MRRLSLALVTALAAAGCSNEIDTSTRPENVIGAYRLISWGGKTLPTTVRSDSSGITQALSGSLVISADRTWTETLQVKRTPAVGVAAVVPVVTSGNWSFVRDLAQMVFTDRTQGYQFTGLAAGGGVTLELVSGAQLVYRR